MKRELHIAVTITPDGYKTGGIGRARSYSQYDSSTRMQVTEAELAFLKAGNLMDGVTEDRDFPHDKTKFDDGTDLSITASQNTIDGIRIIFKNKGFENTSKSEMEPWMKSTDKS